MVYMISKRIYIPIWSRVTATFSILLFALYSPLHATERDEAAKMIERVETEYKASNLEFDASKGLDHYLTYAALNNPGLRAAFYKWKAELKKVSEVSALPNPMFTYGYFIEKVETRVGPQNQRFALRQSFPWFGTLGNKGDIAWAASQAAYEKFRSARLKLYFDVKTAYYDYYYLGRQIRITQDNADLLTFWESVARTKYKTATANHADVIRAQVELGKIEDELATLRDKQTVLQARLRAALNLPDSVAIAPPDSIQTIESPIPRDSVTHWIVAGNPHLKALAFQIAKEESAVSLARKAWLPGFSIGVDYIETGPALNPSMAESGKDPWMVSASINLPIWIGKNKAKVEAAQAGKLAAENQLDQAENDLAEFGARVSFEYDDAVRKLRLYRDGLVPKAEEALNASYAAYEAGQIGFIGLLDTQRQLLAFSLELEAARTNSAKRLAELELITDKELSNQDNR
jgi:cobalt-zinc-cadmium efflux system outer membrane protein